MKPKKPKKPLWIVLHPETGARLCKDMRWREFACFGTYPMCVKMYKREGNAQNAADRYRVNGKTNIIALHENMVMDASGRIGTGTDLLNSTVSDPGSPKKLPNLT